jgi:hypothetical protein
MHTGKWTTEFFLRSIWSLVARRPVSRTLGLASPDDPPYHLKSEKRSTKKRKAKSEKRKAKYQKAKAKSEKYRKAKRIPYRYTYQKANKSTTKYKSENTG